MILNHHSIVGHAARLQAECRRRQQRALIYIRANPQRSISAKEITKALDIPERTARRILGKLVGRGVITKEPGKFRYRAIADLAA